MNEDWIDWDKFTPPDDVKGLLIKYSDGSVHWDSYNDDKTRRHKRDNPVGWKFMLRSDPTIKTVRPIMGEND
jgi:hypothetical protein